MKIEMHRLLILFFALLLFPYGVANAQDAGGPYTSDANTILLMHFDGDLSEEASNYAVVNHGAAKSYIASPISGLGDAIYFDNSNPANRSYITVPHSAELSLTSNWTIEFWFTINAWDQSHNSWPVPILLPTAGWNANYYLEIPSTEGRLKYGFHSSDGGAQVYSSQNSITTGTWYHVALINDYDNNTIKLVLRDADFQKLEEPSASYTAGTTISTGTQDLRIGNGTAGDNAFNGYIDELRISNVVRDYVYVEVPPVVSDIPDQELIERKVSALNLHRMKYDTSPFNVVIETLLPAEYEAQKPASALLFDAGFVDATGKVYVSEPTTVEQQNVFTDLNQTALYYVCQSFLQYYYKTSEMPIWFKVGFASYEADMRLDDADIKTAYSNYGGTLTSFAALNDPVTFIANNGFAVSYMFGEFMGVYKVWQYTSILDVNASTIVPASWWWGVDSIDTLFEIWSRYFNIRILEENEQNRVKMGQETEHLKYYYRDADAFVFPSFSNTLEEAIIEYMGLLDFEVYEKFSYITMPECTYYALIDGVDCINRYTGGTAWSSGMSTTIPNNAGDINIFTGLIRHELAHLAYAHLPTGNNTIWLNEGFASFMDEKPFTQASIDQLQVASEEALSDATNYFGHIPTFEDTKVYPNPYFNYYLLGQVMYDFIYKTGGYSAVKDVAINYDTGIANLGYSSLETFMSAYYFYYNIRFLKIGDSLTLTTLYPNGGEGFSSGERMSINWGYTDIPNINIEYSIDNGTTWTDIVSNISSVSGTYNWTISEISCSQCRIRVVDSANNSISDQSNTSFNIESINVAPVVSNAISNVELLLGGDDFVQELSTVFADDDHDALSYSAKSSDDAVATVVVEYNTMTVMAVVTGTATITINANDGRGGEASTSFVVNVRSGVAVERIGGEVPTEYALDQNYPNPFNPITTIQWALPEAGRVTLRIYNVQGVEIATLMDESFPPGRYSVSWDASGYASGVYLYRIEAGVYEETKALILIK